MNIKKEFCFIASASLLFTYGLHASDVVHAVDHDAENKSIFLDAVKSGSAGAAIVRGLLGNGLNVNTRISTGSNFVMRKTLVGLAVYHRNPEVLALLVEQKANVNLHTLCKDDKESLGTPLRQAVDSSDAEMAAMLLKAGAQHSSYDHLALMQLEKGNPDFRNALAQHAPLTEQQRVDALVKQEVYVNSFAFKQRLKRAF